MKPTDLLNQPTSELMNKEATRKIAVTAYVVFTIAIIVILGIFVCVKQTEINVLKGKAHNDSIANKSLTDNLLEPVIINENLESK